MKPIQQNYRVVLWEEAIDKVNTGKSYHILLENYKIKSFDDSKFVYTNEVTKITQISEIPNANLTTPQLHDYLALVLTFANIFLV